MFIALHRKFTNDVIYVNVSSIILYENYQITLDLPKEYSIKDVQETANEITALIAEERKKCYANH